MKDYHGNTITVGDLVRHVYEPWDLKQEVPQGRGYHAHSLFHSAKIVGLCGSCVEVKGASAGKIPVYLPELLEKLNSREDALRPYVFPVDSKQYREPVAA